MTFAVHASAGMLVGRLTGNPILGFFFGFISHFLLDMIPHGDEYLLQNYRATKKIKESILYLLADAGVTVFMLVYLLTQGIFSRSFAGFAGIMGAVGGLVPDLLVGIHEVVPKKFKLLERYVDFHHYNHHLLIRKLFRERDINHHLALFGQGLFVAIFFGLIVK